MTSPPEDDLGPLVADLVRTLRDLESEFEPRTESGLPRPPSPRELMRFTSDVGIPAAILLLRTNIEALKLLQRALRLADGRVPTAGSGSGSTEVRRRAENLSRATLSRLDDALADLQNAVEGRPEDEEARDLLAQARELQANVEAKLEARADDDVAEDDTEGDSVPVDVDAELRSIKDEFDDGDSAAADGGGDDDPGADAGDDTDSDDTGDGGG